jgi:hypothetical protein
MAFRNNPKILLVTGCVVTVLWIGVIAGSVWLVAATDWSIVLGCLYAMQCVLFGLIVVRIWRGYLLARRYRSGSTDHPRGITTRYR